MSTAAIILAAAVVAITGIIVGVGLGLFGEKFKVEINEKQQAIRDALPGNNCGGCGYAGCDALAEAIYNGEAKVTQCPVGQKPCWDKIAEIMGVAAGDQERMVAFVKCGGTCDRAKKRYAFYGYRSCRAVDSLPGKTDKACKYGCMGHGSCVRVCQFDAIHVEMGIAVVDESKCTGCQACTKVCPNHLIEMVPAGKPYKVLCDSQAKGKEVMGVCETGCIGCTLCTKQCEFDAIHMDGNVAVIDYSKCTGCGKCADKCPRKVIKKYSFPA